MSLDLMRSRRAVSYRVQGVLQFFSARRTGRSMFQTLEDRILGQQSGSHIGPNRGRETLSIRTLASPLTRFMELGHKEAVFFLYLAALPTLTKMVCKLRFQEIILRTSARKQNPQDFFDRQMVIDLSQISTISFSLRRTTRS